MTDELSLKWGTLKGYKLESEAAKSAMAKYLSIESRSMSVMAQWDSAKQMEALCEVIDALDSDTVYLAWDGKDVSKDEAKEYLRNYGKK